MLFDLEVLSNERAKIIRFDNLTNVFSDPQSGANYLAATRVKDYSRLSPLYEIDPKRIGVLYINLGLNCNFECKYCHQTRIRKMVKVEQCTPQKAPRLLEILKMSGLQPQAVSFWGGEPLVYWKSIKALLPGLRELYPKAGINFPTNGSLLTREIMEFLSKYKAGFYISYDGKVTNRGVSIFDNQTLVSDIKAFLAARKKGRRQGISIMPTQNRCSESIEELKAEFRHLEIPLDSIAVYSIARCNPFNRDQAGEILIPPEQAKRHSDFIYEALHNRVPNGELFQGLRERFDHVAQMYYRGLGADSTEAVFCANSIGRDICIDCTGTIFNCMNIPMHILGNILDYETKDVSKLFRQPVNKPRCRACPYITCCRGGCSMIVDDESPEFSVNCSNLKIMAVPEFRTVVECLLGVYLKKITRTDTGEVIAEF